MKRAIIYLRKSSEEQNLEGQEQLCLDYASKQQLKIIEIIKETCSGDIRKPKRDELLTLAMNNSYDILIVRDGSRLSRSIEDLSNFISKLLEFKVSIIMINNKALTFDLNTPEGQVKMELHSGYMEEQLRMIRDNQRAGIENAKTEGKYKNNSGKIKLTPKVINQIRQYKENRLTNTAIAEKLGIDRKTVSKAMEIINHLS